jgi:hypothetical protein
LKINLYPESLLINKLKRFLIQFIKKYQTQLSQCEYHSDVIFGLWSMDIDWQVPSLCTDSSLRRHQQVQHHSNTRSSCAITLKIKPTTMSWRRCCFKKKSRKLCITNKYKYKIHNKIYPIQHSSRSGKRCIEVTNRDEYKNITTRNVVFFLWKIKLGEHISPNPYAISRTL